MKRLVWDAIYKELKEDIIINDYQYAFKEYQLNIIFMMIS